MKEGILVKWHGMAKPLTEVTDISLRRPESQHCK